MLNKCYQNFHLQRHAVIQKTAETEGPPLLASEQEGFVFQMHLDQTIIFLNYSIAKSKWSIREAFVSNDTPFLLE